MCLSTDINTIEEESHHVTSRQQHAETQLNFCSSLLSDKRKCVTVKKHIKNATPGLCSAEDTVCVSDRGERGTVQKTRLSGEQHPLIYTQHDTAASMLQQQG